MPNFNLVQLSLCPIATPVANRLLYSLSFSWYILSGSFVFLLGEFKFHLTGRLLRTPSHSTFPEVLQVEFLPRQSAYVVIKLSPFAQDVDHINVLCRYLLMSRAQYCR